MKLCNTEGMQINLGDIRKNTKLQNSFSNTVRKRINLINHKEKPKIAKIS